MTKNLAQLYKEFETECTYFNRLRPETIRGYRNVFELFIKVMPEVEYASDLSSELLLEFFKRLQLRSRIVGKGTIVSGVRNSTIKTYWTKLNSFIQWLISKRYCESNPISEVRLPQPDYDDIKALSDIEIRKIYSSISLYASTSFRLKRDTLMVSVLVFCGLRMSEFLALEIKDINIEKRLLTVQGSTSKSKKVRYIPIHPTLLMHIKDYLSERKLIKYSSPKLIVSSSTGQGLSKHGLKHWVKRIGEISGVRFHLHQFRHTFACNLASQNVHAVKIQKLLGHGSLNMTMTYLRSIDSKDLGDDINKLTF